MSKKPERLAVLCALVLSLGACSAQEHRAAVANNDKDRLTVGTVQREIRVGMSGAEVATALGSPNVVTTDEQRRETWVYDRFATETVQSSSVGGVNVLILGFSQSAGARSTTQRTLTIVIKFDDAKLVRDFAYRQSSF